MKREKTWDTINKSAAIVTILSGAVAFLTYLGFVNISGIILGLISISTLLFIIFRIIYLRKNLSNTSFEKELLINMIKEINLICHCMGENESLISNNSSHSNIRSFLKKSLKSLSQYLCDNSNDEYFIISIWELTHDFSVNICLTSNSQIKLTTVPEISLCNSDVNNVFRDLWYNFRYPGKYVYNKRKWYLFWKKKELFHYLSPEFQTKVIIPICFPSFSYLLNQKKIKNFSWWGYLVIDSNHKRSFNSKYIPFLCNFSELLYLALNSFNKEVLVNENQNN